MGTDSDDTDSDDSDDTDSDDTDSDSIDVTDDSSDTDTDSESDEDTTDSDDNSFAAGFAAEKVAENELVHHLEGQDEEMVDGELTVSLSNETLANLWGIAALLLAVNVTLCVWCHSKMQRAKRKVRFTEDQYGSEIPAENV